MTDGGFCMYFLALTGKTATEGLSTYYGGIESVFKLIGLIILCVLIIAASYFTTKFVGKKQLGRYAKSNFKSIDIYRINGNKYLQIIQVGKKYFCISVSKDNVSLISELSEEDITNWPPEMKKVGFKDVLAGITGKKKDAQESGEMKKDFPVYINSTEADATETEENSEGTEQYGSEGGASSEGNGEKENP